jgi:ABC-type transport system involved in multi-copper enzyme maturation permease subunit
MNLFISPPVLFAANPTAWLTPVCLLGLGCLLGLAVLVVLFGIAKVLAPKFAEIAQDTLREGFVTPVLSLAAGFAAFALLSLLLSLAGVGYLPLSDIGRSLARLPYSNRFAKEFEVNTVDKTDRGSKPQEISLDFRPQEMREVEVKSDLDLEFLTRDAGTYLPGAVSKRVVLERDKPWKWPVEGEADSAQNNPFSGRHATLYVFNPTDQKAKLFVTGVTREEFPQVSIVPVTAAALIGVILLYMILRLAMPKIMAVASATSKEAVGQPLFQIILAIGAFALVAFVFIPYQTFGEDVKMLKMCALELIMALAILVGSWTASVSISEEIEGRTALTVLSKPIGRIQFIMGKFFGVVQSVSLLYMFLGAVLLITVSGKVVYDVRESSLPEALWTDCFEEMSGIVPGLLLAFFGTIVITSISVAIATRLPMVPNLLISFSVYVLGNLAPMLVQSPRTNDSLGIVHFVGQFLATILPVLENFTLQAAISAGKLENLSNGQLVAYLSWALLYCVLYSSVAMLLALIMFEDRDLA